LSNWQTKLAIHVISRGGVIAYPTESVYGLGCDPNVARAVARILTLKHRDPRKGLIIVAATFTQIEPFIEPTPAETMASVLRSWPGPVTWVLPAKRGIPDWLRGEQGGIAVRISAHPVIQAVCRAVGPLVSTSANPEGYPPAITPARVRAYFHNKLDFILPGPTGGNPAPTEIRHALTGKLLRASTRGS